jgi:hypothetical protein
MDVLVNGLSSKTVEKLRDKAYRDAYVESHIRIGIPYQIAALREQDDRRWSQAELGRRVAKPASVICRLEDPQYGRLTIRTLLELASAFDVALLVKFVSFSRFLDEFEDVSPEGLQVASFTNDPGINSSAQYPTARAGATLVNTVPEIQNTAPETNSAIYVLGPVISQTYSEHRLTVRA